jgi:ketosteroid isomerase-like protein
MTATSETAVVYLQHRINNMKTIFVTLAMLIAALLMFSCGGPSGANNTPVNNKAANSANTASAPDPAASEAEIRKLMDTAAAALAKNDADAMDKIYADNYMLVNIDGSVQNRSERLASLRSGDTKYSSFAYSEPNIRFTPAADEAVVIAKLSMKGTAKGKAIDGDYRVTQVYSKMKDGWKQITASAVKIEGGSAKPDDKKAAANTATAANSKSAADTH